MSNGEFHFTRHCVNLVTHTNITAICVTEADFWSESSMLEEPVMSWNTGVAIRWNNAKYEPLRRSRSFKVTDFSTNQKLIYDFLLMINTNLPPILNRFRVTVKFSLARGECLTLTLSLGVIPANIAISDISLKTRFFGLHFCCRKYPCNFNQFYVIDPESYRIRWHCTEVMAITPFKVIHSCQFCYQSKAHMWLPNSD